MSRLSALMLGLAVFLPLLTLVPLGSLWLWQHGYLLHWVIGALMSTALFYVLESRALRAATGQSRAPSRPQIGSEVLPEDAARAAVERVAAGVDPQRITSRADLLALGATTIEAVAREIHPSDKTPVWNFTVPDLLLLTERVSARLRDKAIDTLPLGEQLTVGQAMRLYEWRSAVEYAERAYDVWRILRLVNPIAAATQEARERITRQIVTSVRDDLARRILRAYVTEVGLAAIDLYTGRLKRDPGMEAVAAGDSDTATRTRPRSSTRIAQIWREAGKLSRTIGGLYGSSKHRSKK